MSYNPPHTVDTTNKETRQLLAGLIRAYRRGDKITPLVINGDNALTGSHRIAAVDIMLDFDKYSGMDHDDFLGTVEASDEDYTAADNANYNCGDFNDLCRELYNVTNDDELKAALEDQF